MIKHSKTASGADSNDPTDVQASDWNADHDIVLSAQGSIIIGGVDGVGEELAIGTNGQVLTLVEGMPSWSSATKFSANLYPASAEVIGLTAEAYIAASAGANQTVSYARFEDSAINFLRWSISPKETLNYSGGSVTVSIIWNTNALTGKVKWQVKMKGAADAETWDQAFDVSTPHTVFTNAPASVVVTLSTITFTPTAAELTAGDLLFIEISRVGNDATDDTVVGYANIISAWVKES